MKPHTHFVKYPRMFKKDRVMNLSMNKCELPIFLLVVYNSYENLKEESKHVPTFIKSDSKFPDLKVPS